MKRSHKKILMIFIEPTPYILDLLENGFTDIQNKCDVFFLTENLTQNWNLESYSTPYVIFNTKRQKFKILINIFIKRRYSLVHVAGWSNPIIIFILLFSRFFNIPVVSESDTPIKQDISIFKKILKRILYPILFKFPVFFLTGGIRQMKYLAYYGVKNSKMKNAQMTVDITKIDKCIKKISVLEREQLRSQYGAQKDNLVFLFVGRLLELKGILELISASQLIENKNAKIWIVGNGALENEVRQASQKSEKITYFGRMEGDALWRIYYAADVFVLPSHSDAWGLVVNEAMAAQCALIITSAVGCVDDLVSNFQQGLIIEPKNVTALHDAMLYMLENMEMAKKMAENANMHISGWTLQNEAKNIISVWKMIVREKFLDVYS